MYDNTKLRYKGIFKKHIFLNLLVPILVACTFDVPSDISNESKEVKKMSVLNNNVSKPRTLEVLMDVPSSSLFADLIHNILNQLGLPSTETKNTTGWNPHIYLYIHTHTYIHIYIYIYIYRMRDFWLFCLCLCSKIKNVALTFRWNRHANYTFFLFAFCTDNF